MRVGDEDIATAVAGLAVGSASEVLADHVLAEGVGARTHVEYDARSGRRQKFYARRRPTVFHHVGLRPRDGSAAAPYLDGGGGAGLLGVRLLGELNRRCHCLVRVLFGCRVSLPHKIPKDKKMCSNFL